MLNFFESYFFYKQIFWHKGNGVLTSKLKTGLQWETNQTVVSFLSAVTLLNSTRLLEAIWYYQQLYREVNCYAFTHFAEEFLSSPPIDLASAMQSNFLTASIYFDKFLVTSRHVVFFHCFFVYHRNAIPKQNDSSQRYRS